jgi:hypothetical protein
MCRAPRGGAPELRCGRRAFSSVCLAATDDTDEFREVTRRYREEFGGATAWTPHASTTFAGALQ